MKERKGKKKRSEVYLRRGMVLCQSLTLHLKLNNRKTRIPERNAPVFYSLRCVLMFKLLDLKLLRTTKLLGFYYRLEGAVVSNHSNLSKLRFVHLFAC